MANGDKVVTLDGLDSYAVIWNPHTCDLTIGCKTRSLEYWQSVADEVLDHMDGPDARNFRLKYRSMLESIIEANPIVPPENKYTISKLNDMTMQGLRDTVWGDDDLNQAIGLGQLNIKFCLGELRPLLREKYNLTIDSNNIPECTRLKIYDVEEDEYRLKMDIKFQDDLVENTVRVYLIAYIWGKKGQQV